MENILRCIAREANRSGDAKTLFHALDLLEHLIRRFPAGARSNRTPLADQRALLFQRLEPRDVLKDIQARPRVEEVARLAARCGG